MPLGLDGDDGGLSRRFASARACVNAPKCQLRARVSGASPCAAGRRVLKEERNYILQMIKKIRASGANVLLIQKSILRDAVTDLSLHYLVPVQAF